MVSITIKVGNLDTTVVIESVNANATRADIKRLAEEAVWRAEVATR